jgi:hypothetical protein
MVTECSYVCGSLRATAERRIEGETPMARNGRDVLGAVTSQIDWWWHALFRPRLAGLTDEEYLWEPAPRCWTIRPHSHGESIIDFHWPPPKPAPFTTIGWRLAHIATGCLAHRTSTYFPDHAPERWDVEKYAVVTPFPASADAAIAFIERWWHGWRAGLAALDDAALWEPIRDGEGGGDFSEMKLAPADPFVNLVLHNHRELMHHGAEISLLRDLYLANQPPDAFVTAVLAVDRDALAGLMASDPAVVERYAETRRDLPLRATETGRVEAIRLVAELGFDLNAVGDDGHTALHHAAAGGHLALIETLLDLSADPTTKDVTYGAEPAEWAQRFLQHDAAELLVARRGKPT